MIISHKYKFLFIGLPFSASSAISKDLHAKYEGKPYLRKHSLYHEFNKVATINEKNYFVFAVLRNPLEIAITVYEKMKANAKGNFTNPKLFVENGGHITKKHRKRFNYITNNNATFQEFFLKFYHSPYDNFSSITLDKCNYVIRYENLQKEYLTVLKRVGVLNPKKLPVANKTVGKKNNISEYYTLEVRERAVYVFGPFLEKYNYSFPENWQKIRIPISSKLKFIFMGILRKFNERFFKRNSTRKSIEGTIYGDMQRLSTK
tara:strand:- start:144 stop:926 length:783 start_codon:yes stop_codon:yes gene_type:complete